MTMDPDSVIAAGFCFVHGIDDAGDFHVVGKRPGDDFAGVKIHDAGKVNKSVPSPDVGDIGAPDGIGDPG